MSNAGIEILMQLATAIAAGLLIGAEREHGERRTLFAGVRTFPLFAMAGALSTLVNVWLMVAVGLGVSGLAVVAYGRGVSNGRARMGTSTEAAALVTYGLGALSTSRDLQLHLTDRLLLVIAGATCVMGLLSVKRPLKQFMEKVSPEDVYATAKLLILAAIVLPLLPDAEVGPLHAINPRQLGLLVVMVSTIGFAGYVAIRMAGTTRGLELTGFFGGFASSTAVTLAFAEKAKFNRRLVGPCAFAITVASATMFPRMLLYTYALSPGLGVKATAPFIMAGIAGFLASWYLHTTSTQDRTRHESTPPESLTFSNPFSMSRAFRFATLLAFITLLSHAAAHYFDNMGVYLAGALAGTSSTDAATLSIAKMHRSGLLTAQVAVDAIGLAALTNTLVKAGLAAWLGGKALGVRVSIALLFSLAVGFTTRLILA